MSPACGENCVASTGLVNRKRTDPSRRSCPADFLGWGRPVDISPIPGERPNFPADKVRISRQPLDLDWQSAHCVVVRETEAPPKAGGGRGEGRKAQSEDRIQRLATKKDRKVRPRNQPFDEAPRED